MSGSSVRRHDFVHRPCWRENLRWTFGPPPQHQCYINFLGPWKEDFYTPLALRLISLPSFCLLSNTPKKDCLANIEWSFQDRRLAALRCRPRRKVKLPSDQKSLAITKIQSCKSTCNSVKRASFPRAWEGTHPSRIRKHGSRRILVVIWCQNEQAMHGLTLEIPTLHSRAAALAKV